VALSDRKDLRGKFKKQSEKNERTGGIFPVKKRGETKMHKDQSSAVKRGLIKKTLSIQDGHQDTQRENGWGKKCNEPLGEW